tara:strand:- start:1038 stop:2228 length:1191 start_codon:yes stop_codon:yes gene_type:complete
LEFSASADFDFQFPNASAAARQQGRAGELYLTNLNAFVQQVLVKHPGNFRVIDDSVQIECLAPAAWRSFDFSGQRVLFLLPSHALGNNVPVVLFIEALREKFNLRDVGVFCTGPTHDIYLTHKAINAQPIWIGKKHLKRWHTVVDLGHLQTRQDIDVWPIDMETELLTAFGLEPSTANYGKPRPLPRGDLQIGILPLTSTPLRTLPVSVTKILIKRLQEFGRVTLCLNRNQHQGVLYQRALGEIDPDIEMIDVFASIGDLITAIGRFDYAVFADSGPAHMSKLFGTPGVGIYTSAPGDVLQGRFRNLTPWTVPYEGSFCRAPCGLARVRATRSGTVGCMGSLQTTLEELPNLPRQRRPEIVKRLLLDEPVPCVAKLADCADSLAEFIASDIAARRP